MTENFPNLAKELDVQVREAQRVQTRGIQTDLTKIHHNLNAKGQRERILKAARERKLVTYKGTPIRRSADFSMETL